MKREPTLVLLFAAAAILSAAAYSAVESAAADASAASSASVASARAGSQPSPTHSSVVGPAVLDSGAIARREGHPRVFLSWQAPYGLPGARDSARAACDDSLAADTLYLTFDPGEDIGRLMGIDATLVFRAAPGDTLGPFWDLSRRGVNPWNLRIEFDDPPAGIASPWAVAGMGAPRYTLGRDAGRLDLTYFVPSSLADAIAAGTRYFMARVILRLRRPRLEGCRQAVCVEFDHLLISYAGGSRWINAGERFATWNSPDGGACREPRLRPPSQEPMRVLDGFGNYGVPPATGPAARDSTRR